MENRGIGIGERKSPAMIIVAVAVAATALGSGGWFWLRHQDRLAAETKAWTISGPACAPLDKAGFEAFLPASRQVFEYNTVIYSRYGGHVSCANIAPGEANMQAVCQFSGPGILKLTTAKGDAYFAPGVGHKATTSVSNGGEAHCVLGATETF